MSTHAVEPPLQHDVSQPVAAAMGAPPPPTAEANLAQLFRARADRYADKTRWRQKRGQEWRRTTYRENQRLVNHLMCGLDAIGARPGEGIGILSGTRWEWLIADWAVVGLGGFTATLYPTLVPETILFILNNSGARFIFVDNAQQYKKVRTIREQAPQLEKIIIFDEDPDTLADPMVIAFADLLRLSGRTDEQADAFAAERARQIQLDDCAGVIYTSGTTGQPKGVEFTHRMLVTQLACLHVMLPTLHAGMVDALWVPLAHGMGRLEHIFMLELGAETAIIPSLLQLARDLPEIQPDLMLGAPRLYEKAHATMVERAAGLPALQRMLFHWAIGAGERAVPFRQARRPVPLALRAQLAVADRLVFRRLRAAFGGRMHLAMTGGAPIDGGMVRFFRAIGIPLLDAWGLTETTTVLTINQLDRFRIGTVGTVFPGNEVRIAPDGEVLARGPLIFKRYLNNPKATAEALDAEGWLHTGDEGTLDRDGFLTIIDRKKDLIVTSGGDKIAPQHLETLLDTIPVVAHTCVYGDRKPYPVALLTLEWSAVREWATKHGLDAADTQQVALSPEMRAYLDQHVAQVNAKLQIFERIKAYSILTDDFTLENGLLTATLKIRRKAIYERYRGQFEQLYASGPSAGRPAAGDGKRRMPAPGAP